MPLAEELLRTLRLALATFLLLPFLLTQFFAPGTMPEVGQGGFQIVICTESGFQTVVLTPDGTPVPAPESNHPDDICPWATMGHSFVAGVQPVASSAEGTLQPVSFVRPQPQIGHAARAVLPPSRAPPRAV